MQKDSQLNKQREELKLLLKEFYLWMQENDYEHTIPKRVESKAEDFLNRMENQDRLKKGFKRLIVF